jgi:uroporphyrinogen-III decarboxylase
MQNVLLDFYENPTGIRALMRAICDFHLAAIRSFGELGFDGISISDDLGTQTSTMFSRQTFLEFYKPLYRELFGAAHDYGMHTWMHCCGHLAPLLDDLIDAGLDAIHPIQYSTYPGGTSANDPRQIARDFAGRITFWTGIDVQYLLPLGTQAEVRRGVRELIDLFDGPEGGLVIACGNGIMPETPFENIQAFFDEAYEYGLTKRDVR